MASPVGRALLIAAWVVVIGGLAGGAGYLHSLGPPEGPPVLTSPEAAPASEAPPRLDSGALDNLPGQEDAIEAAPQAAEAPVPEVPEAPPAPPQPAETVAIVALETPVLPQLGDGATSPAAPPSVTEAIDSLVADATDAGAGEAGDPESLADLTGAARGDAARFVPATEWPVTTPGLYGPMPMIARQTINLSTLGQVAGAADPPHETAPAETAPLETAPGDGVAEPVPPPVVAEAVHEPEPPPTLVAPPPAEVAEPAEVEAPVAVEPEAEAPVAEPAETPEIVVHEPEPEVVAVVEPEVAAEPVPEPASEPAHVTPAADPDPGPDVVAVADIGTSASHPDPLDEPGDRPVIAIVIGGLGLSSAATEAAIQSLPAAVTLSFSPYSGRLQDWVALARAAGHEVLIDLPMEPADYPNSDPGPQALMTGLPAETNMQRLDWVLSRATGYVGVGSYMGSRFASDAAAMRPVLEEIAKRGLIYLDNGQSIGGVAASLRNEVGLRLLLSDAQVDRMAARTVIDESLVRIEAQAARDGAAVAIGTAYPVTIERLAVWTRSLADRGIALAPVSDLVGR